MIFPIFLAVLFGVLIDTNICSANPGLQVQVTKKGFDYATQIAIDKLYEKLKNSRIPDVEKNGRIYYKLYNIKLAKVNKPSGQVILSPRNTLKFRVSINDIQITGNYKYSKKIWFFTWRRSGYMRLSMSGTRLDVTVVPTKTSNGGLAIRATGCSCSTRLNVRVSGWILRIILYFFKGRLTNMVQDQICRSAISTINSNLAPKVTQFPVTYSFGGDYVFNYGLVSNPLITNNYMKTSHKAMVYYKNYKGTIPFMPNNLPSISDNKYMLYFIISNYVFDTWLFAAHQKKLLQYKLSTKNIPPGSQHFLQTTCPNSFCIGTVMPQIDAKFPNSTIQVTFSTSDRPKMSFLTNRIQLSIPTVLQFSVEQSGKPLINAFTVFLKLSADTTAKLGDKSVFFSVTKLSFKLGKISGTYAGRYDLNELQRVLQMVADNLIPYFNEFGAKGMPIAFPKGVSILKPEVRIVNNAIILGTNLKIG